MTDLTHFPPKMRPFIIAVHAEHFKDAENGLATYTLKTEDLVIALRGKLEEDERYRQVLPNFALTHKGKVWAYRRTESGGESRLHGKVAVSVGGHWDLDDLITENSQIDLSASLTAAAARELDEEVQIDSKIIEQKAMDKVIAADDTDVDRVHVAIVNFMELDGIDVSSKEEDLDALGFFDPQELLDNPDYELETWARIICEQMVLNS